MADKKNSLLKKTLVYGLGTFGSKVLTFLLVPLYSFYLNREEFGYFDLVITSINLIVPFISLQISDSMFRWLFSVKEGVYEKKRIISNGFVFLILNIALILVISSVIHFLYPFRHQLIITLLCISAVFYPFVQQIARGLGNSKMFAMNGVLYTVIYLVGNLLLLVILKWNVEALFYSTLAGYVLAGLFLFFRLKIWTYLEISLVKISFCKELLGYSLPLVPNTISWWLINSANKYIIALFLGVSANGIFAMSNRFPVILVMINQIFTLAWQEAAIVNFEDSNRRHKNSQVLEYLIKIQFSFVMILSLISQFLVERLISPSFYESWRYMPVLYLSVAFLSFSGFYGAFYLSARKTKEIFTTTIFGGIINLILAFVFVKYFGLMGISIATLCGYIVLSFLRMRSVQSIVQIDFPSLVFFKYGLLVIISFFVTYQSNLYYSLVTASLISIFLFFDNRILISAGVRKLKKNNNNNGNL